MNAHLLQLGDHPSGVRPGSRIKGIRPHFMPVAGIDHQDVDGQAAVLVFTGNREHLLLAAVAQTRLPETGSEIGKMRCLPTAAV